MQYSTRIEKTTKPARIKIRNDRKRSWDRKMTDCDRKAVRRAKYSIG